MFGYLGIIPYICTYKRYIKNKLKDIKMENTMTIPVTIVRDSYSKQNKVFPTHKSVNYWTFSEQDQDEAALAHYMAVVAEKSGMNANDLQHLFPAVLRMLKSECNWAK